MKRLLIALLVIIMAVACGDNSTGKAATDSNIKLETVTKGFVDKLKEEYKGKTLIVNFFASWCPPCRGETPDFIAAYEKHKGENFVIIGISVDKKVDEAAKFVEEFKVTYPVYHADNSLGNEMNISTIPTSMIFKPDGKLYDIIVGPMTTKELDIIAGSFK